MTGRLCNIPGHGYGPHSRCPETLLAVSDTVHTVSETSEAVTRESDASDTSDTTLDAALLDGLRDGAWLDQQEFPPLSYAVPGLIPEGLSLLIGPPKAGKSWLILAVLLAVAEGGIALGRIHVGHPRRVLYLALEDGDRRMQDRCRKVLGDYPIPSMFHYITHVPAGKVLTTIEAFLRRYPDTALVVVDTLGKVMPPSGPGESAYQRDYRVGGQLKRVADNHKGLAVTALHHDRKAISEDFVDSVSGTNGLAGAADTIIVLARQRQSTEGLLMITGRDVAEDEFALTMVDGIWQLDGANLQAAALQARTRRDSAGLSDTSTDIMAFVRAAGPPGVTAGAVAEKFGKDAYKYLQRQHEAGRLLKPKRGVYIAPDSPITGHLSEVSEVSEPQVSALFESDTERTVSETASGGPSK